MHSAIRDQNQQQPKPTNNKKKKRIRKKGKKNKENHNQIRILYANVNGARGKITSLQAAADSQNSHIVAIAETKGNPPALEGYAPWYHKPRPDRNGGGVAITVRNDLKCNTQIVDDLEDNNQEIIWIQISINKKKKIYAGVYYGKQENAPKDEVAREMSQLRTQITKLSKKGHIILTGDFNAKITINRTNTTQTASRNGRLLEEVLDDLQLSAITTKSKLGTWTRVPWNKKEPNSTIDYIIIKKGDEQIVTENIVDETEALKIQGVNKSDHNTLCLTLQIKHTETTTKMTRWKINNEDGWAEFNKEVQKIEMRDTKNYSHIEAKIKNILGKTIGKVKITTNRPNRSKESEEAKNLRKDMKEKRNAFNTATKKNKNNKQELMEAYLQSQYKLKKKIEEDHRQNTKTLAKRITREGGTKSQLFWKEKRKITPKQSGDSYITLDEKGNPIEDPEEAKEHIAQYFENLYQAREGRPQFEEWTNEIKNTIKTLSESDEMKGKIDPIEVKEIENSIKTLKNGKATGPDEIPNEIFTKAEPQTVEIYKEILQTIANNKEIPEQWQKGQIIRLYKGKGKRGMCSNERGITLASNFGKLFERILNNRAKNKINMTDNQAGGQKGKATTDHLAILNEVIKEIRNQGKPAYMVFLDVTKAYDKAWLDAIMYVMHKEGLKGPEWDLVKKMNENLSAQLSTRHGNTREIRIKDSIRQGGVLSVLQYALLIDEINKEITKKNLGTYIGSLEEKIGCLLWMDDVLLISSEPKELQLMLEITNTIAGKYHIEFGEEKSNVMKIGRSKNNPEFTLGDMNLKYTDKYKYLGYIQNNKNNLEDHIKALKGKVENAYQTLLAIAGNKNFNNIEMQTIWELTQSCIESTIAYSNEIWNPGKTEQEKINRIMDNIIKRILMVPQSTPREALYIETGLLDPEAIRLKNRVLMEHRITNGNSQRMKELITNNTTTSKWAEETKKAKEQLEIDERDVKGEKTTVKNRITNRVKDWFKAKIEKESNEKSKIQHLLEGLTGWEPQKRARYMNKLTRQQASTIFKARTRMLPVKNNYRNKYRNHTCRACGELVETQKHVLEDCEVLHIVGEYKVYNKEIFSDNPNKLRTTATNIQNLMDQLNNIAENEVTTTPKQPKTKQTSTARQKKGSSSPATRGSTQWWCSYSVHA